MFLTHHGLIMLFVPDYGALQRIDLYANPAHRQLIVSSRYLTLLSRCLLLYTVSSVVCKITESRYRDLSVALFKIINYELNPRTVFGACEACAKHFIVMQTMRRIPVLIVRLHNCTSNQMYVFIQILVRMRKTVF